MPTWLGLFIEHMNERGMRKEGMQREEEESLDRSG